MTGSKPESQDHEERLLIDGRLTAAKSGATFNNINPATEEVMGVVADASAEDMDRAIAAARKAFDKTDWATNHAFRKKCLEQLHTAINEEKELLRAELVAEVGAPITLTYGPQLDWPLSDGLLWPAQQIETYPWNRRISDQTLGGGKPTCRWVWKEPIGVIAAVIPWNFPFEITINKIGPALATGNTMIIKAATQTPWNATRIGRLIAEKTEIPPGVVNVVTTQDHKVSNMLFTDSRVDMVSFTGSTATGRLLLEAAAPTFKRTLLELGGKSANILLDDCMFEKILPMSAAVSCMHAGQGCALPTRLLLPRSRYETGVAILNDAWKYVSCGDPNDINTIAGPLVTAMQRDRVLDFIEKGKAEGARLLKGGGRPKHLSRGWYVEPTLFVDVDNMSTIAQEEIFGPVLSVIPFDDDDDAIRIANQNKYGLSGMVWSASTERALNVARKIRTGSFMINGGNFYGAEAPYGGYRQSGNGRQCGIEGFEQHLETKVVGSEFPLTGL
ncbi:MAG: aldehyde dehydrogenase family protein [Desulfobacterium sp.]|nr:aldehyde dehydrogenase family protein [Desulfobacterium sp.]MBU3948770.1 aldehyde dehydrogenase family protein [Pseudomonadota bacterium]MBU4037140.1 aldehyde dehydrogenase family protein [Pseudomonadota bacterium]